MEPRGSLPCSQPPATCSSLQPDKSNQSHPIRFIHSTRSLPSTLFPSRSSAKILYAFLFSPYVLHAPLISYFSIWCSSSSTSFFSSFYGDSARVHTIAYQLPRFRKEVFTRYANPRPKPQPQGARVSLSGTSLGFTDARKLPQPQGVDTIERAFFLTRSP